MRFVCLCESYLESVCVCIQYQSKVWTHFPKLLTGTVYVCERENSIFMPRNPDFTSVMLELQ